MAYAYAGSNPAPTTMVAVAQLVERRVVVSVVEGSSPSGHPKALPGKDLRRCRRTPRDVTPLLIRTYNYLSIFEFFVNTGVDNGR